MGYLKIDNRASGGGVVEADTTWCRHCQGVIRLDRNLVQTKCRRCGPICTTCAVKLSQTKVCVPIKQVFDQQWEARELAKRGLLSP